MTASLAETQFCEHCLKVKPLADFRRRSRGGTARLNQCRACHNEAERMRRASRRSKQQRAEMAKVAAQLKNAADHQQVALICSATVRRFGGLSRFVTAWIRHFEAARKESPGSKKTLDFFQAVQRMIEHCDAARPDPGQLTDAELNERLVEQVKQLIQQQPELAVAAAHRLGWTVIPQVCGTEQ